MRIAINGYGRIGRCLHRQILANPNLKLVAINSRAEAAIQAHLLKYDSIYGTLPNSVRSGKNTLLVDNTQIPVLTGEPNKDFKWKDFQVDVVVEATGKFTNFDTANQHLKAGAKHVLITAPCKDIRIPTFVVGVNDRELKKTDRIISNASCTTNCVAPLAKVLHENFGIRAAQLSTIHAATNNQNIHDNSHPDLRRARSFLPSIVPTKTGVSSALARVYPAVAPQFAGISLRVPTLIVSLVDLVVELNSSVTAQELEKAFLQAAQNKLQGILTFCTEELVSIDFRGNTHSTVIDGPSLKVLKQNLVKILAWYDNEWAYAARVKDLILLLGKNS